MKWPDLELNDYQFIKVSIGGLYRNLVFFTFVDVTPGRRKRMLRRETKDYLMENDLKDKQWVGDVLWAKINNLKIDAWRKSYAE